eukprot:scaffold636_cov64-Cylindrotheca_fusiformis.AAC.1
MQHPKEANDGELRVRSETAKELGRDSDICTRLGEESGYFHHNCGPSDSRRCEFQLCTKLGEA